MAHTVDPTLRPVHIYIYEAICEAHKDYGVYPSQKELALATQLSTDTVVKVLKDLKAKGYILHPKHQVRAIIPTDLDRTLSIEPLDAWADLRLRKKYFKGKSEKKPHQ